MVFENTENTKNKNTPSFPNKFFVFFVFKNKKQFLKTGTKQALCFWKLKYMKYEIQLFMGKIISKTCTTSRLLFLFPYCP